MTMTAKLDLIDIYWDIWKRKKNLTAYTPMVKESKKNEEEAREWREKVLENVHPPKKNRSCWDYFASGRLAEIVKVNAHYMAMESDCRWFACSAAENKLATVRLNLVLPVRPSQPWK